MKLKQKIFVGIFAWIALAATIHFLRVRFNIESQYWNDNPPDNFWENFRDEVFSFGLMLTIPGQLVSENVELIRGPFAEDFSLFEEVVSDIFYALLIALIVWKFPFKSKKP